MPVLDVVLSDLLNHMGALLRHRHQSTPSNNGRTLGADTFTTGSGSRRAANLRHPPAMSERPPGHSAHPEYLSDCWPDEQATAHDGFVGLMEPVMGVVRRVRSAAVGVAVRLSVRTSASGYAGFMRELRTEISVT